MKTLALLVVFAGLCRASQVSREIEFQGARYVVVFDSGLILNGRAQFVSIDRANRPEPRILRQNHTVLGLQKVSVFRMRDNSLVARFGQDQAFLCGECQSDPFMWLRAALEFEKQLFRALIR